MSLARTVSCAPVRLSSLDWLLLQALALWPHGAYLVERAVDGSDDPLGLIALAAAALLLVRQAPRLRLMPRVGWLAASLALACAANLAWIGAVPALAASLLAALALAASLAAWWPADRPRAPMAGLLLLALPLMASLQFYVGWPLRVVTAELSSWCLQAAGLQATRSGASMLVNGQLVIVDAPCSGVQMAWLGYFAACIVAAFTQLPDGHFVKRLPLVGAFVLLANVLRNSVLVALEARPDGLSQAAHQSIGLVCLALVFAAAAGLMNGPRKLNHAPASA